MLKPSELGVTGVRRTIYQHKIVVVGALIRLLNVRGPQSRIAKVCLEIMNTPNGGTVNVDGLSLSDLREIKNYFSEVMGPIWCHEQHLIPGIKSHDYTLFENTSRMYDFKVYRGDTPILISNKRHVGVTNTLKPSELMRLIDMNPDLSRKWRNSTQYNVMRILDENSVVSGPIKVIAKLYPHLLKIGAAEYQGVIRQLTRNEVILDDVPDSFLQLIEADATAAALYEETEQVTGTMINFIFEKILIEQSKNDPMFTEMYIEATQNNIMVMKFELDLSGRMYFSIEDPSQTNGTVALRSKQGIERRDMTGKLKLDKLGLTVL